MKLSPVILAGGGGTRLWPLSREHYPKQFLSLFGANTLLQNTLLSVEGLNASIRVSDPVVICNEVHRFLVAEQSTQISKNINSFILEPVGRNTAPALTIAALHQCELHDDAIIVMLPADHVVKKRDLFQQALAAGVEIALDNKLVTFGIEPTAATTAYGYIHTADKLQTIHGHAVHKINGFTEKPHQALAEAYINTGDYLWNSGIFMMKASVWLEQIQQYQEPIYAACWNAFKKGKMDGMFFRLDEAAFLASPDDSIDYAVMEKLVSDNAASLAVIPINVGWSDIGAWSSVWEISDKDDHNNVVAGDVIAEDTNDCFIKSDRHLVVAIGCRDMVIVDTDDAVMIVDKNKTQHVKKIVDQLKQDKRSESALHRKVYRPWGSYDTIDAGEHFQVKRLTVNPGKKISLQLHHKRAEHWVVVKGVATVTRDDEVVLLQKNESTYIPVGMRHRLENATDQLLEIIEVQSGEYLGEDDIVRFDDDFGRH